MLHIILRFGLKFSGVAVPEIPYRRDLALKRFLEVKANWFVLKLHWSTHTCFHLGCLDYTCIKGDLKGVVMEIYDGSQTSLAQVLYVGNAPAEALRSTTTGVCVYLVNESRVKPIAHPHCSAISYFLVKWLGGSSWILPGLWCQTIILPVQTSYWVQSRAALSG